jgi:hypothetical protein
LVVGKLSSGNPVVVEPPDMDYFGQGQEADVHATTSIVVPEILVDNASVASSRSSKFVSVEQFSSLSDKLGIIL